MLVTAGSKCNCTAVAPVCTEAGVTPAAAAFCSMDVGEMAGKGLAAAGLGRGATAAVGGGGAGASTLASSRYTRTFESVPAAIGFKFSAVSEGSLKMCGVSTINVSSSITDVLLS